MKIKTIKARIGLTVATLAVLLLLVGGLAIWATVRMSQAADLALEHTTQAGDLREMITSIIKQYQAQADTVINFHVDGQEFDRAKADFDQFRQKYAALADAAEEKEWAAQMEKRDTEYCALYREQVLPAAKRELAATDPAEKIKIAAEITKLDDQSDELIASVEATARKGIASLTGEAHQAQAEYARFARTMRLAILVLSGLALVSGVGLGVWTASNTSQLIKRVAGQLQWGSDQTVSAAGQVATASQTLAEGSSEQAASIEETSASLEEMASMTKRNADNAHKANELAREARAVAERGSGDMQTMAAAMQSIKESSDDIAKIIKTIDEIAFQTNILALNAAVEAARAGEAGMGFAVVADEVRNLAQRSAQAARETAAKIEGAIGNTAQGVQISAKVAQVLSDIVTKVREVDELVAEVSGASREQTQGIAQINAAVGQMDKVTQNNAASAEESAAAAGELNAQAAAMKAAVNELLLLVSGHAAGEVPATAPAPSASINASHKNGSSLPANASPATQPLQNGHAGLAGVAGRRSEIPLEGDFQDF